MTSATGAEGGGAPVLVLYQHDQGRAYGPTEFVVAPEEHLDDARRRAGDGMVLVVRRAEYDRIAAWVKAAKAARAAQKKRGAVGTG